MERGEGPLRMEGEEPVRERREREWVADFEVRCTRPKSRLLLLLSSKYHTMATRAGLSATDMEASRLVFVSVKGAIPRR